MYTFKRQPIVRVVVSELERYLKGNPFDAQSAQHEMLSVNYWSCHSGLRTKGTCPELRIGPVCSPPTETKST